MGSLNLLLDTHTLIWWLAGAPEISAAAQAAIADQRNRVFVSSASAWEIATKFRIGKLPEVTALVEDLAGHIRRERFESLPISIEHAQAAGLLPGPHRDPFDRMLIAQSRLERMPVVGNDPVFRHYGAALLW